jgi:hypothetical protein
MISLVKILLPIGRNGVKFRDFIIVDVLTSLSLALGNLTVAFCLLYCVECKTLHQQANCHGNIAYSIVAGLPYLLRYFQTINKLYFTFNTIHLIDSIKYICLIGQIVINYCYYIKLMPREFYIACSIFIASFTSGFDLRVDFNVLHIHSKNFMLRDKLMYPKWFYYYAMVMDIFTRFFWFLQLIIFNVKRDYILLTSNLVEVYRRFQWVLLRVENENLYNLMSYRSFLPVPTLPLH